MVSLPLSPRQSFSISLAEGVDKKYFIFTLPFDHVHLLIIMFHLSTAVSILVTFYPRSSCLFIRSYINTILSPSQLLKSYLLT
jgi:hypothetical protein